MKIKEIKLSLEIPFGQQLKPFRKMMGFNLTEISKRMDSPISNVCHFEKGDYAVGNSIRTVAKYSKALGIKQIKIVL